MEGTKRRAANSLGMFDLLKGVGMLTIVFAHTGELYPMGDASHINPLTFCMFAYRESLMAAFYIASGYGFRYETYKVLGGFALGLPHTATYFGQLFFSCGPMWYLLSLMIAWVLLDLILNIFPEQYINWAVLGTMLLGWGICITWEAPFCIGQGMVTVPALYVGYLAKKHKIFEQPLSPRLRGGMIAAALAVAALVLLTKSTDCVSMAEWTLGPVSILLDAVTGLGILSIVIWFQRRVENVVTHAIQAIGRRSLFIFCVHTVELTAIPWYLMPQKFAAHPVLGMVLQFTLSLGSTLLICELLVRRRDLKFWLTSRREQKAAEAPRRRSEAPERHFAAKH